jgi:hypothetical protein
MLYKTINSWCYSTYYSTLLNATRRYSTLLDATQRYPDATRRYPALPDATRRYPTLPDATRRYLMLPDATRRYSSLLWPYSNATLTVLDATRRYPYPDSTRLGYGNKSIYDLLLRGAAGNNIVQFLFLYI